MYIQMGVSMCTIHFTHPYISTEWATDSPCFVYMFCSMPGPVLQQHQGHIVHCSAMLPCNVLTCHFHSEIDNWIPIFRVYTCFSLDFMFVCLTKDHLVTRWLGGLGCFCLRYMKSLQRVQDSCSTLGLVEKPIGFLACFVTVVYFDPKTEGTILALH